MCLTDEIIEKVLSAHNQYRLLHGAGSLKYSVHIGELAQAYALQLAESGRLEHSAYEYDEEPIGENLARWTLPVGTQAFSDGKPIMGNSMS